MEKKLNITLPFFDTNYIEVDDVENKSKMYIFKKEYLNIVEPKIDITGIYFLLSTSYGKKNMYIDYTENIMKDLYKINKEIDNNKVEWYYDIVVIYKSINLEKENELLLKDHLLKIFVNNRDYNLVNFKAQNKTTNNITTKLMNDKIKEIEMYFSLLSLFNININVHSKNKEEDNKINLPKDYKKERPDSVIINNTKIVGWIYKEDYDLECYKLVNVVKSFFTFLYSGHKEQIIEYMNNTQNKYIYPVYINEEKYNQLKKEITYNYEKILNSNIYIYMRMNTKFFIKHSIEILKAINLSTFDLYFVTKNDKLAKKQ